MFTDQPVTPRRLEILLDVLREFPRGLARSTLLGLLQPEPLLDKQSKQPRNAAEVTLNAARQLKLVEESDGAIKLMSDAKKDDSRAAILRAFDGLVLSTTEIEPHFALFYAWILGRPNTAQLQSLLRADEASTYSEAVFGDQKPPIPFNATRLSGLHRWFNYAGLGWYDPAGEFQPNPYSRLLRALPGIFANSKGTLTSDQWMAKLAEQCPELDGGTLFLQANRRYMAKARKCSLGLSQALVELDLDGIIRLYRPADSSGWSVEEAQPPIDPDPNRQGTRISLIELLAA
jgi:hypothetical protein